MSTLQIDPTRTLTLRKKFMAEMVRRFKSVRKEIWDAIVTQDALGLEDTSPFSVNVEQQAWRFQTDAQKLESFSIWLQGQIDTKILSLTPEGLPWTAQYVESAYRKGVVRAYTDVHAAEYVEGDDFFLGGKQQFLQSAFAQPETVSKIQLLATRSFEQLKGVTSTMASQMNLILADGITNGHGPKQIARDMSKRIAGLTNTRALTIARTETIYAHAEGQLDSMQLLGVEEVEAMVEFSTAGDDRVCAKCASLSGQTYTIKEARGIIPVHPNCRCAWLPAFPNNRKSR